MFIASGYLHLGSRFGVRSRGYYGCRSGDTIWGWVEKELKPADTVAYIRPICDVRVMEGREIREKRAKGTLKRDADEINEDESEIGSEEESKAESEINPFLQKESSLPAESKGIKRKQTKSSISAVELEFETEHKRVKCLRRTNSIQLFFKRMDVLFFGAYFIDRLFSRDDLT